MPLLTKYETRTTAGLAVENSSTQIRAAYKRWFVDRMPGDSIAITITFNETSMGHRVSEQTARSAIRIYSRMLNLKAYGNSFKRRHRQLTFIPVREGGRSPSEKHPHYHLLVEVPAGWTTEAWTSVAEEKLRTIKCFGNQADIQPVRDEGWLDYILKKQDKKSFDDAIDIENLWLN